MAARKKALKKPVRPSAAEVLGAAPGGERPKDPNAPAPATMADLSGGPKSSAVVKDAIERLRRDKVWVPYPGGFWAKAKARISPVDDRPVGGVGAFVVQILVKRELAEFTKWKPVRGGKTPLELKARA